MKGKLYWFVALIGGCALFLMSPIHATYAYLTDTKTIPMNLSLEMAESNASTVAGINITGNLELSFEKYTTPVTKTNTPMIELKTGDLGYFGDVLLNVKISSDKDGKLPIRDVEKYFTLSLPETVHFYGENKKQTQMQVTKNADFPDSYYKEGEFKFYVTITANIGETKTSSKTFAITDHNGKTANETNEDSWPKNATFINDKYYVAQNIYYTVINNGDYKQLNEGVIYIKLKNTLNSAEIDKVSKSFLIENHVVQANVEVFPGDGIKVTIKQPETTFKVDSSANLAFFLKMGWISGNLSNIEFGNIVYPFLLNTDFTLHNSGVKLNTTIYTRSTGVNLKYATQQHNGSAKSEATLSNLSNYATWRVSDTNNFAITAQSDTSVTIKQNSSSGGETAELQLVSKADNQTVLFSRRLVSVNEDDQLAEIYNHLTSNRISSSRGFENNSSQVAFELRYDQNSIALNHGEYSVPVYIKFTKSGLLAESLTTFSIVSQNNDFTIDSSKTLFSSDGNYMKVIIKTTKLPSNFAFRLYFSVDPNKNTSITDHSDISISIPAVSARSFVKAKDVTPYSTEKNTITTSDSSDTIVSSSGTETNGSTAMSDTTGSSTNKTTDDSTESQTTSSEESVAGQ